MQLSTGHICVVYPVDKNLYYLPYHGYIHPLDSEWITLSIFRTTEMARVDKFYHWIGLRDLSEISRGGGGGGGGNFKFGFGNEVAHPCNGSEIC